MAWQELEIEGVYLFTPMIWHDERGYFVETFNQQTLEDTPIRRPFVQDNEAKSTIGVLRGLHYQRGEHAQAKLVRAVVGKVLDVIVDLRSNSTTFGQHLAVELDDREKQQLYVPRGFAHGYLVLSDEAIFAYKCDNYYNKSSEGGLRFNDPQLHIDWRLDEDSLLLSEKDLLLPKLGNHLPR